MTNKRKYKIQELDFVKIKKTGQLALVAYLGDNGYSVEFIGCETPDGLHYFKSNELTLIDSLPNVLARIASDQNYGPDIKRLNEIFSLE